MCRLDAMTRRRAPPTRYTLQRNTASIMKGLVWSFNVIDTYTGMKKVKYIILMPRLHMQV